MTLNFPGNKAKPGTAYRIECTHHVLRNIAQMYQTYSKKTKAINL